MFNDERCVLGAVDATQSVHSQALQFIDTTKARGDLITVPRTCVNNSIDKITPLVHVIIQQKIQFGGQKPADINPSHSLTNTFHDAKDWMQVVFHRVYAELPVPTEVCPYRNGCDKNRGHVEYVVRIFGCGDDKGKSYVQTSPGNY